MRVLIIIPAYNEEKNLAVLLSELKVSCPNYDLLVVNDCSKDNTAIIAKNYGVNIINLPVNLGIGGAVQTGYKYAYYNNYDIAVQVDGDGQHDPKYIDKLVKEILNGSNLCIGSRFINKKGFQSSNARRLGIRFFSKLINIVSNEKVTDPTSGFRACDRQMIAYFARQYPRDYPEPETIVVAKRKNLRINEIPVIMNARKEGKSSISSIRSVYYMIKVTLATVIASIAVNE